jgi:dTDP-glucose 4,6-dehydratase
MKSVLVTGGAGFIGSNFIKYVSKNRKDCCLVNLDALTYAGNLDNLADVKDNPDYIFVKGNIVDRQLVTDLFDRYMFDSVINFAAESHVDRSIENPEIFITTNIIGTQSLLEAALRSWKEAPGNKYCRKFKPDVKFLQISTDEVYGTLGKTGLFTENTPLAPNSPYSASKAGADFMVRAYHETFGLPVNITRCSNNYGPYQFPEKLIPLIINNCLTDKKLPLYGDGYVWDHCAAVFSVLERGTAGEVYNIGGNNEKTNMEIVKLIVKELGKTEELIEYVQDRPGHDRRYAMDNTKITTELGWKPEHTFEGGIKKTIEWYLNNKKWLKGVTSGDYMEYYEKIYTR